MSKSILKSGLFALVAIIFSFSTLSANNMAATVGWTAFKTPAKIGVKGNFDEVKFVPASKMAKDVKSFLVGGTIEIATSSVNTKNKGRDANLVGFFFDKLSGDKITGKVLSVNTKKSAVVVELTMNGTTKATPLKYSVKDGKLTAKGHIDMLDFQANAALASISKKCFAAHKGKTWNDVDIRFSTPVHF